MPSLRTAFPGSQGATLAARRDTPDAPDSAPRAWAAMTLRMQVRLKGPLEDSQRQRLPEIADKCPLHRTLHGEVDLSTRLKDGARLPPARTRRRGPESRAGHVTNRPP